MLLDSSLSRPEDEGYASIQSWIRDAGLENVDGLARALRLHANDVQSLLALPRTEIEHAIRGLSLRAITQRKLLIALETSGSSSTSVGALILKSTRLQDAESYATNYHRMP